MKNSSFVSIAAVVIFFCQSSSFAGADLTVYNQGFALVREQRLIKLKKDINEVKFTDIPAMIDPLSVFVKSLTAPESVRVIEQSYEYDLVSRKRLLKKYLGQEISIERTVPGTGSKEVLEGTLIGINDGIIIKSDNEIIINPEGEIRLSKLPEGFVTKPALSWLIENDKPMEHQLEVSYITGGISWEASYIAVTNSDEKNIDFTGWVTVDNRSGVKFSDASLKLVAGDINVLQKPQAAFLSTVAVDETDSESREMQAKNQFQSAGSFEYQVFSFARKITINDMESKQAELLRANSIPVKKIYTYEGNNSGIFVYGGEEGVRLNRSYGANAGTRVGVRIEFINSKVNNLGLPLPRGKVKVYKRTADGLLEFIGEDTINHTPKTETVKLDLGYAFDIAGERTQVDFRSGNDWCEETFNITLKNTKDRDVEIRAREYLYRWNNWKITDKSQEYEKKDSRSIEFKTIVPKNGQKEIKYTVRYSW